ncbi:capsular polysaccharide export protein, LipB/KpsS family [Tabrizicola oligotrophica]|uniref:Capsular biosynthesis protein n=1 Tax=Tabrizicola oligotrophica TaxID=2710650 RepID=A0A6M0QT58_9RHOB|nr:capsular biosynthesis protein [Tabrizicola oligotrophica]NEY89622.1 capsular biosynthesis protein [Tabrizicola oligotrophica]
MIVYPEEFNAKKAAVFRALAEVEGGARRLWVVPLSPFGWPETRLRVDAALARAKKPGRTVLARWAKRALLTGQYNWARRYFARHPEHLAVAWNGLTGGRKVFLDAARDAGAPVLHAELAPLPGRITLDPAGVNAEGSVPRDPDFFRTQPLTDWRAMGVSLAARASRRTDVQQTGGALPDTPFLFCPLQVPDDSQVRLFAGWSADYPGFIRALTAAVPHLPPGWHLRLKEHPSAKQSLRPLLAPLLASGRAVLDNATDSFAQLAASQGVVTLNSSMGLQAFFHDKPVITLGRAFFALPGLVTPCSSQAKVNAAFAAPQSFDAGLREGFMSWLEAQYYPRFSETGFDRAAFAAKCDQSRRSRDKR